MRRFMRLGLTMQQARLAQFSGRFFKPRAFYSCRTGKMEAEYVGCEQRDSNGMLCGMEVAHSSIQVPSA